MKILSTRYVPVHAAFVAASVLAFLPVLSYPSAVAAQPRAHHPETSPPAPDAPVDRAGGFSLVENKYKGDAGQARCLRTFNGNADVKIGDCNAQGGASDYTSMRQWKVVDGGNGYVLLENKYKGDAGQARCLRTFNGNADVKIGDCNAQGGASDYTSMRQWKVVDGGNGYVLLENKYKGDAGQARCLRTFNGNADVKIGDCNAQGGASDYTSMRQWKSDAFAGAWPSRPVVGKKRVLVMATHWTGTTPAEPGPIRQATLGNDYPSLRSYLKEVSRGKLDLSGDMLTDVDLGPRPEGCASIRSTAKEAARDQGVDPDSYDYLFVDISRHSACKFEGLASMPGNWIISNGVGHKTWMWTHEFGHNLGFQHSKTLKNCPVSGNVTTVNGDCTQTGGDDPTDTMGGGGMHLYPVDYRQFAGWLTGDEVVRVRSGGKYQLGVLGKNGVQEYRIPRGDGTYLSLEFRRPVPPYDDYAADDPLVNGIFVRIVKADGTIRNTLVDATPATPGTKDATLTSGKTLVDETAKSAVKVCSVNSQGADLRIAIGGSTPPAC
ncbi:hypothetical protein [Embleya sp. NPDC005971]|uniref:hypothetical protein n=1 Tax=Embleya sp. NPDC005971 TaxID=3156724 RepID=UPI0033DF87EC